MGFSAQPALASTNQIDHGVPCKLMVTAPLADRDSVGVEPRADFVWRAEQWCSVCFHVVVFRVVVG